jgi:hypothetical protein
MKFKHEISPCLARPCPGPARPANGRLGGAAAATTTKVCPAIRASTHTALNGPAGSPQWENRISLRGFCRRQQITKVAAASAEFRTPFLIVSRLGRHPLGGTSDISCLQPQSKAIFRLQNAAGRAAQAIDGCSGLPGMIRGMSPLDERRGRAGPPASQ